jgi:predicted amidohydrolase YtcJ
MLIRNAEVWAHGLADVKIEDGRIACLTPPAGGTEGIDARGGALLPGLHDHHLHLAGLAARAQSVWCGPPQVEDVAGLELALASHPGEGWIRGIGYHESLMDLPTAAQLDRLMPHRPLRMQHRSGRMWLLNSQALAELLDGSEAPPGMERSAGKYTGRLFDEDEWLQRRLASAPPDFSGTSRQLARYGVTGITDMTPRNDPDIAAHFVAQQMIGALQQNVVMAGTLALANAAPSAAQRGWKLGPAKLHLHEAAMPDFAETVRFVAAAHEQSRAVAIHCVSEVELVYALAVLEEAGVRQGDRIEHASVAAMDLVQRIAALGLAVCAQPRFVHERGDAYRRDVEPRHQQDLYRLASLAAEGIVLAGGSDAPFCSADPWAGMRAAVDRKTASGRPFGPDEAMSPEGAVELYLADPLELGRQRRIAEGAPADLVLLDRPWREARTRLLSDDVRHTWVSGKIIDDGVDQAPV